MDVKLLFNQIKLQVSNRQNVQMQSDENRLNFYIDGRLEFYVRESGGVSFVPDCSYTDKVKQLSDDVINTSKFVRGYLKTIEEAPEIDVGGVDNKYKLLAQFNNTILAGRATDNGEHVEFGTWDKTSDIASEGHYFGNNFIGAKEDFAVRADIVNKDKIFTTGELIEIYRCVEDTICGGYEITDEQEEMLKQIQSKISDTIPDLNELISEAQEQFEQTMQ